MKKQDGFTLVELIVVVAIGAIVMASASTVLLLGLRLNNRTAEIASEQNKVRAALYVMETTAKQSCVQKVEGNAVVTQDDKVLFKFENGSIYLGETNALLLDGLDSAVFIFDDERLLSITITIDDEPYVTTVYCRTGDTVGTTAPPHGGASADAAPASEISLPSIYNIEGRNRFLSVLSSEVGSTGQSMTTGEYFSEWYIGGYEANPGWSPDTPWCVCFLSWALEQCGGDLFGAAPRYAHVDKFLEFFPDIRTDMAQAQPGDVIFFDMEDDGAVEPTHVGAVVRVADGSVRTIEGNTNGTVAGREYALNDERIIGYGVLNWK